MRTIEIPGGHATLRENHELRGRDRRLIRSRATAFYLRLLGAENLATEDDVKQQERVAAAIRNLTGEDAEVMQQMQDATIIAHLVGWTLPDPAPTMDTIADLPDDVYAALAEATKDSSAAALDIRPPDPNDLHSPENQGSPTEPSYV